MTSDTAALHLRFDAWEGPLDLLLALARAEKVDLRSIPIVPLVDQYLAFVAAADAARLELKADYLVMAAWLTYLKSALLLPPEPAADPDPEAEAAALAHRLRRLDAMRRAADALMAGDRIGRDVFPRAAPEGLRVQHRPKLRTSLPDLLRAYAGVHTRAASRPYAPPPRAVVSLEAALERMAERLPSEWVPLSRLLVGANSAPLARSALASGLAAGLELVRRGQAELEQDGGFGPIRMRACETP